MICVRHLYLAASGDWAQTVALTDESGAAVDLTGQSAAIVDVTGVLGSAVAVTITDALAGLVRLSATWQAEWPLTPAVLGTFRLQLVNGAVETTTQPATVYVAGPGLALVVNRGSDMRIPFTWQDDRDGADLTGETVDVINASAVLASLVSVEVLNAATRSCQLNIEGDLAVTLGDAGSFQLRRRIAGAAPRTLQPIEVTFK